MRGFPRGRSTRLGRGSLALVSLGTHPGPALSLFQQGCALTAIPQHKLIPFARVSGHAWGWQLGCTLRGAQWVCMESGQYWTAAADSIICCQRASRKQHWGYSACASQVLMRLLLPYASFPYKRESYFSSSRQDSWESHTEKYRLHAKTPMQRLTEVCHTLIKKRVTSRTALSNVSQEIVVKGKLLTILRIQE